MTLFSDHFEQRKFGIEKRSKMHDKVVPTFTEWIEGKEEFFKFQASVETLDAIDTFDILSISLTSIRCFSVKCLFLQHN